MLQCPIYGRIVSNLQILKKVKMNQLDQLLFAHTEHEKQQLSQRHFVADFPELQIASQDHIPAITQQVFGNNKEVYISKHSRFADYPAHSHQFLEINYIYHGECNQIINGKEYHFTAGDIILMDNESVQEIKALGEEDILINILFRDKDISLDWLNQLKSHHSSIYQLLLNATISDRKQANFAVFSADKTQAVQPILQQLLKEYFFPTDFSEKLISHYLSILIFQLARTLSIVNQEVLLTKSSDPYIMILKEIDNNYQDITLSTLASRFNFNKNYLSNLIKERSGQTFTQLVTQRKLTRAQLLLQSTQLPIYEVAQQVGFSNKTYFYEKYRAYFGHSPKDEREKEKTS